MTSFKNASRKGLLYFLSLQLLISLIAITAFQQLSQHSFLLIIAHAAVIISMHVFIFFFGILLQSVPKGLSIKKVTQFIAPLLYGLFLVLLFYTYLLAFYGQIYNSRIFTFEIFWGYLIQLNGFIDNLSLNYPLVYIGLFGFPLLLFAVPFFLTHTINAGLLFYKELFIDQSTRIFKVAFIIVAFSGVLSVLIIYSGTSSIRSNLRIRDRLFRAYEPIFTVFFNLPIQGQFLINDASDKVEELNYPSNLSFDKKNVIIITLDAVRPDHLSLFGYHRVTTPFLDSLFKRGELQKMSMSFSAASASFAGINSILRSKIWAHIGYENFSIQKLLRKNGYQLNFLISGNHTTFYKLKSFYGNDSDFNLYLDGNDTKRYVTNDDRIIFEGLDELDAFEQQPAFFYFHLNSAHFLGKRFEKNLKYKPIGGLKKTVQEYINHYDNGILQADDFIKQIFDCLRRKKYLQNSMVIITADHGEALGEDGLFGHALNIYNYQISVPIIIYDVSKNRKTYQTNKIAHSIDIAPTILDRLGLPIPKTWEGRSLLKPEFDPYSYHQMLNYYAIIKQDGDRILKYIYNFNTKSEEVYNISTDFHERLNLIKTTPKITINDFRSRLSNFRITPLFKD